MDDVHDNPNWETLTDPILLCIFSKLDTQNLSSAGRTCKNWYRVSLDEKLWRTLAFQSVGCCYACDEDITWKSELKRLIYHVPVHLHQTCEAHPSEIHYVCFSNSGNLIATCGEDTMVKVWKYGNEVQLLLSKQVRQPKKKGQNDSVNYVEFNEKETHLIAHVNIMSEESLRFKGIIMVLSIQNEALCPVAARCSNFPSFRGTWLKNDTFLLSHEFDDNLNDMQFLACTFFNNGSECSSMKDLIAEGNVETKSVLRINQPNADPEFVKVIDWSQWNGDVFFDLGNHLETNEKVVILYFNNVGPQRENELKFFRVDLNSSDPVISEPIRSIRMNCFGLQLSPDHRYLVCNTRQTVVEDSNLPVEEDVIIMVIPLENEETTLERYRENLPLEYSSLSVYFSPHVSSHYVAAEPDQDVIFLWDRKSRQTISKLSHRVPGKIYGASAVAFHPHDQEVLVTVSNDCRLRVWISKNRLNAIQPIR